VVGLRGRHYCRSIRATRGFIFIPVFPVGQDAASVDVGRDGEVIVGPNASLLSRTLTGVGNVVLRVSCVRIIYFPAANVITLAWLDLIGLTTLNNRSLVRDSGKGDPSHCDNSEEGEGEERLKCALSYGVM